MERNETAPSELVKRLTALAEEQVLDAELDPEGWGRAAAEQRIGQQAVLHETPAQQPLLASLKIQGLAPLQIRVLLAVGV